MQDRILNELIGSPEHSEVSYDALMPRKVRNLLLVSSLYDYYTIIEDGKLSEMLLSEYLDLDLRFTPSIERVSTAEEALEKLRSEPFDLVISMARVGNMNVREFGEAIHEIESEAPVVLLAASARELSVLPSLEQLTGIDMVFVWMGDVRLFLAIAKHVEDRFNALHDAKTAGVRSIILVEDSVQFYSSYLPMLYTEIMNQTRALMAESISRAQRTMRMRARPKVLLARTYEESLQLYEQYKNNLLGVIVDAAFPRNGAIDQTAGFEFARLLKKHSPDLPVLMQSDSQNAPLAASIGLVFVDKSLPTLHQSLREFMQQHLGFGDFVLRRPDGTVIGSAPDLRTLEWALQATPDEYIQYNVTRNDFYAWFIARTEFELADTIRAIVRKPFADPTRLRQQLLHVLKTFRERSVSGVVAKYSSHTFEGGSGFVRIGEGSLGGKGRGLAFVNSLIKVYQLENRFPGVRIMVPPTVVLASEVFDRFLDSSGLLSYVLKESDDDKINRAFLHAALPAEILENLWNFLQWVRYPLAVRSSSLLEDASYQPFAGIYKTYMIPNNHEDPEVRLEELCNAIKMVYASTYHADPKAYMESLPNRLEEERMAVIIQQVVGTRHGSYIYPHFAGVARSVNFYTLPGMDPDDGIVSVALGMGKTVVDGGRCFRFCPAHSRKPIQSFSPEEYVENSQKSFLALDLSRSKQTSVFRGRPFDLVPLDLKVAESDGTLSPVASVYSAADDAVYDGLSRDGVRVVTMAGVLKGGLFPLAEITSFLLKVGRATSSCPVEIEFAVNLSDDSAKPHEFAFLQIRPLVLGSELQERETEQIDERRAICISHRALGNGLIKGIRDVIYVRPESFDRAKTTKIAEEIGQLNRRLKEQKRLYLLIGPGRWGSADPWLGIPVKWAQISAVQCIIETGFEDMQVDPSQGSHFFQNIMSFGIGYLTVDLKRQKEDFLDTHWLDKQPAETETEDLRHITFDNPLPINLNGRTNLGVVAKPI